MEAHSAWVLNLDADVELAKGSSYTPTARVRLAMRAHQETFARALLGPADIVVDEDSPPGIAAGFLGRAFCPTPRAIRVLTRAGASIEPHPSTTVLRTVNSRAFCASLGPSMEDEAFVEDASRAFAMLERRPAISDAWRLKRAFGMAGRGQRIVRPSAIAQADRALVTAAVATEGGIQIEPHVRIVTEYALHGTIDVMRSVTLGRLCVQRCDASGQWIATEIAHDVPDETRRALEDEARRVGDALANASYFGPFNVDAFTYRDDEDRCRLRTRSEINARHSMGFAIGFDLRRRSI